MLKASSQAVSWFLALVCLLPKCQGASALPSPHCGQAPTPAFDREGRSWFAFSQHGHIYLTHSDGLGVSFAPPLAVNREPEAVSSDGKSRPKLALGPAGETYLSWTLKIPGKMTVGLRLYTTRKSFDGTQTELMLSESSDPGDHWSEPRSIASSANDSDHPQLIALNDKVFVSWHNLAEGSRLLPITR